MSSISFIPYFLHFIVLNQLELNFLSVDTYSGTIILRERDVLKIKTLTIVVTHLRRIYQRSFLFQRTRLDYICTREKTLSDKLFATSIEHTTTY